MIEIPLNEQIEFSSDIIEAEVIEKESKWDNEKNNIYTINTLKVYSVYKGLGSTTFKLITEGGVVDDEAEIVDHSLELRVGDIGLFFLTKDNLPKISTNNTTLQRNSYSGIQGFYMYDFFNNKAINPFHSFNGIEISLQQKIINQTGDQPVQFEQINQLSNRLFKVNEHRGANSGTITSFSPRRLNAGTGDVLTILGDGFGDDIGEVMFSNANTIGQTFVSAIDSQIISWSNTMIEVEVPSLAGSRDFIVKTTEDVEIRSPDRLRVTYALRNINRTDTDGIRKAFTVALQNINGNGGYTLQMNNDLNNNPEIRDSFIRALDSWRCTVDINFEIGPPTDVDTRANDGVSAIIFDDLSPLVLGGVTSRLQVCEIDGRREWYVNEIDIRFNRDILWEYGPERPENSRFMDFESVVLHELGHAIQLGHVISNRRIMHASINFGVTKRELNPQAESAAAAEMDISSESRCDQTPLTPYNGIACTSLSSEDIEALPEISIYPNPASSYITINTPQFFGDFVAKVFDISGRTILSNNKLINNQFNVSNLSPGIYIVQIILTDRNNKAINRKFVIQ